MTSALGKYGMKYAMRRVYKNGRNDPNSRNSKYDDWVSRSLDFSYISIKF